MDYSKLTVVELKRRLKERNLKGTGRKEVLISRLKKDDAWVPVSEIDWSKIIITEWKGPLPRPPTKQKYKHTIIDYHKLTMTSLKEILKKRRLPVSGKKQVLVKRLGDSDIIYNTKYELVYPRATTFLDWVKTNMKIFKIDFKEINTQDDSYKLIIGEEFVHFDWKHLSEDDIYDVNERIEPYGYAIEYTKRTITSPKDTVRWIPLEN